MIQHKEISQDFIQEKYMQLLEESYITTQEKSSFISKKTIAILGTILLIGFITFNFLKPSVTNSLFQTNLVETVFNANELLIKSASGKFYKIPTNKNWITDTGLSININSDEIKINSISSNKLSSKFSIYTPNNKTYHVVLPDLSKIQVNKNSILEVNLFAKNKTPNIILKGEAFFNIAKQISGTFNILANNMNIEVIGTEFNVSNYQNTNFTQLSLVEGVVKINNPDKTTRINAGQQATLDNKNLKLRVENKDFSEALAWLHKNIYFEDKPLNEISEIIANWYDVKFVFTSTKLKNAHFTGTLEKEKGLTHFLQMLKYAEGVKYKISNKIITLKYK